MVHLRDTTQIVIIFFPSSICTPSGGTLMALMYCANNFISISDAVFTAHFDIAVIHGVKKNSLLFSCF